MVQRLLFPAARAMHGDMTPIQYAVSAFVLPMSVAAAAFWIAAGLSGGAAPVIEGLGLTAMVLFTMAHLPAMAGAILLWRWQVARGVPLLRWGLFGAMIYFSAACIIAFFGNFMAASVLGMLQ